MRRPTRAITRELTSPQRAPLHKPTAATIGEASKISQTKLVILTGASVQQKRSFSGALRRLIGSDSASGISHLARASMPNTNIVFTTMPAIGETSPCARAIPLLLEVPLTLRHYHAELLPQSWTLTT